jgi:uncharacterized protein YciI
MDGDQNLFAIIYNPGPSFRPGHPELLQGHQHYIQTLRQERKLIQGGPFGDTAHGAPVIQVKDEAEARAVASADPAVKADVLQAVVLVWNIVFGTHRGI